ncbi:MBL fold metallo-hydrolase [Candidatus Methanocrinis natronophilus]|uniref:MBL fold metallo-hydrolase n=1 Tax=Candidatus Methanocrinis natronophilus TaxID=3033396 RepID=A0ABT5X7F1_9EURY|nr:MBL fold metallo-hydrolase [Candidatus Methanocrinis natronophilus]MDF0590624.1 MBL fold metallo-hydrolase [Candidatus Methanocrinis natronophilus]
MTEGDIFKDMGVIPVRRMNRSGRPSPHLSLSFDSHLFSIDTSRSPKGRRQPDAYLITHAHSDHYGKSAMLSADAIATMETARALRIRHERRYEGRTVSAGGSIQVDDLEVAAYSTGHTIGSVAFGWETDSGVRVLVTGDIKNYENLPRCDLLVTEANYGDPWDPACRFEDDIVGFGDAVESGATFGAYAFGKAQRAVSLIRALGCRETVGMDDKSLALTKELLPGYGPFTPMEENGSDLNVVSPWELSRVKSQRKYVLTGRSDLPFPQIRLSDHLDFKGLMRMVEKTSPDAALIYHPEGSRANMMAHHLRELGMASISVSEIKDFF